MRKMFVLLAILAVSSVLLAQTDFLPVTTDAKALAMGGCIGTARGAGAILRNPAGIGWLDMAQAKLSARTHLFGSMGYDEDVYEDLGTEDYKCSMGFHPKLNNIAFATPIPTNAPFGIAGGIAWGPFFDFAGKNTISYTEGETEYEEKTTYKGGFHLLMPTVAAIFAGNFAVGASYGFAFMSPGGYKGEYEQKNPDTDGDYELKETVTGSMLQIGAQGRFIDRLDVGFSYVPAFDMKLDDREYELNETDYDWDDIKYEFPAFMAIGASFDVTPEITIAGEYQNRPWDDLEIENTENGIENGTSIRAGIEYRGPVALRAGFFTDKLLYPAEEGEDEPASGMGFTGGVGFMAGPVGVDVAAFYQSAKWEEDPGTGSDEEFKVSLVGAAVTATYETDLFGGK
ncbi:hypothetical protein DRQ36_00990 [bacterium]|nr:MAG: hypothetical protein DRQ36_00990 [bacterium]